MLSSPAARSSLTILLATLSLTTAWAVRPPETTWLGMEPGRIHQVDADPQAYWERGEAWQDFVHSDGAGWEARFDQLTGTPHRMWGPGFELGPLTTEAQVEQAILSFIAGHADVLGLTDAQPVVKSTAHVPSMDAWYVDVDTLRDGLPIWRGGLTFRIKHGRLTMIGADTYPNVPLMGEQEIGPRAAIRASIEQGHARNAQHTDPAAELMWLPVEKGGRVFLQRVWRTESRSKTPMGQWVSFVDAETGTLLNQHNTVRFFDGQLAVEHDVRLGDGDTMMSPLANATVQSDVESTTTAADGTYTLDAAPTFQVSLEGPRVRVSDQLGIVEPTFTPAARNELTAVDFDNRLAPATTFVYVQQVQDWAMEIAPEVSWSDARARAFVNLEDSCNAYFDGNINFLRSGRGCSNTGRLADVIFHEWGHGFHTYSIVSGFYDGSVGEGAADTIAFLQTDDSRIAPFFYSRGVVLRDTDNNQRYPEDYSNDDQSIHFNGLIFGGSFWDTREALRDTYGEPQATTITSTLLAGTLKGGPDISTAYDEAVFADDDDGNLANGTPHQCELIEGFGRHGLGPKGGQGLVPIHTPITSAEPAVAPDLVLTLESPAPQCFELNPQTASAHYRVNGGIWNEKILDISRGDIQGQLPAGELGDFYEYWVEINDASGGTYQSPSAGEIRPYTFYVGDVLEIRCDDFDKNDGGFSHALLDGADEEGADDWQWGPPNGAGGDPERAYSGANVWGNDLGAEQFNGEYQNEKHNRLSSREYNTRHYQGVFLRYQRWLTVEDGFYDKAQILADGEVVWTNWATSERNGGDHHLDDTWASHVVDLGGAGDDGTLQVSWDIVSDPGLSFGGWNIDDVCIYAPATADNRLGVHNFTADRMGEVGPVILTWNQPRHAPIEQVRLVRKVGSYPDGPNDGVVLWETSDAEPAEKVSVLDHQATGKADLFYAVYATDGEAWLSWTVEGLNADSIAPSVTSSGCNQGAPSPWWLGALGLLLVRRRQER